MLGYVEMNFISICMCISILVRNLRGKEQKERSSRIFGERDFDLIIWATITILTLNTAAWVLQVCPVEWLYKLVLAGYHVTQVFLTFLIFRYCRKLNRRRISGFMKAVYLFPAVVSAAAVLINLFYPFAYQVTADCVYKRLSGYQIVAVWPLVYIVAGALETLCFWRHDADKETGRHLLIFTVMGCVSAFLGTVIYGVSIWPLLAFDIVYLYLNVQSRREQEINILAFKDSLTGLGNAAAYRQKLNQMDERLKEKDRKFAVVVMDVNNLKKMNDTYGHKAGNELLIQAGRYICHIFDHSPVFRIGGDEFVAILENSDYENREKLLEQFDREMENLIMEYEGRRHPVSVARGMAEYKPVKDTHYADVFQVADHRMYENKIWIKSQKKGEL